MARIRKRRLADGADAGEAEDELGSTPRHSKLVFFVSVCVCCFVLLNRYWGIVTVPGVTVSRRGWSLSKKGKKQKLFLVRT